METLKKIYYFLTFVLVTNAYSQTIEIPRLDSLAGQFIKSLRSDEREKIFMHTDKWFYEAGEVIRFRAYCVSILSHKISKLSKNVFVDLINEKDSVIAQLFLNNSQLKLEGYIALSPRLSEGYYWIRAYTKQMLNQDSNSICIQPIYLFNRENKDIVLQEFKSSVKNNDFADSDRPQLTFYPEGGALISGTNSVVALSSQNKLGEPLPLEGFVKDNRDSIVATFKTGIAGLGKFDFYVWKSRKYTAFVKWEGLVISYPLTQVNQFASQISVIEQNNNYARIKVSLGDSLYKKKKISYLLGISRDSLCFAATGVDMYEVIVPKSNFPQGKATFILFNELRQVVSERNIYIDRNDLVVDITPYIQPSGAKENAKLDIAVGDSKNHPLRALFSLSVVDDSLDNSNEETSIYYELINDNIEFVKSDVNNSHIPINTAEQWDLIMLTQKTEFLQWNYCNDSFYKSLIFHDSDTDITSINGEILDKTNQPQKDRIVTMISNKSPSIFATDTTDVHGRFHFPLQDYPDSIRITLQVANLKGIRQLDRIIIDTFSFPKFITPSTQKKRFSLAEINVLQHAKSYELDSFRVRSAGVLLKEVIVKGYIKKPPSYDQSKRLSSFSRIVTSEQIGKGGFDNINNALLLVPGVGLRQGYLVIRGAGGQKLGPNSEPLLVVNGVPMDVISLQSNESSGGGSPVMSYLNTFEPGIVDFIEVLSGPEAAMYGMRGANGVILVNTKTKVIMQNESIGLMNYYPKGYGKSPTLGFPDYSKKEARNTAYPDQIFTVYWKGTIFTDNNGKASVSFFIGDSKTTYTVTMEGISSNGVLLYKKVKINR